jgi:hypothetical protein
MKKRILLFWLTCCVLLLPVPLFAEGSQEDLPAEADIQISAEDQEVIALMELLEKMEMLTDLDLMTAGEVKK